MTSKNRTKKERYTNADLSIWFESEIELDAFQLIPMTRDNMFSIMYPQSATSSDIELYDFNNIDVYIDKQTQQYIISFNELIDNPDGTVIDILRERHYFSMHNFSLRLRYPDEPGVSGGYE